MFVYKFLRKYSPQCESCNQPIIPKEGSTETIRVVAMDKNYHIECYVCKGCRIPLSDEFENRCFPIDGHLFCYSCFMNNFEVQ
jgi:LIM domain-containing protein